MGKIKKLKAEKSSRNVSLSQQIKEDKLAKPTSRIKTKNRQEGDEVVNDKLSKKILEEARKQQEELEEEFGSTSKKSNVRPNRSILGGKDGSSSESEEKDSDLDEDNHYDPIDVNEEDERALELFMNRNPPVRRTLADIIMEKITEKQTEIATQFSDAQSLQMADLDERVVEVFKGVRQILSKYRSGKLPKAFKIIPSLANWEQILYITEPDRWSAAAVYQATRIFTSNLKEKMAQRFFNLVLLPRIRDDIAEYKRLNVHLYQALRKSLFKPGAFFKGILLPLCESGNCTLREAIILSSVIAKNSIPVLHSAAAMLKIAEMDYSGGNSIFLRVMLDKKYALPFRVVDALVYHFLRFQYDKRELPVLWHQALLSFVQRYKEDLSSEQKDALYELLRAHSHYKITPEIRRELQNSKCRDGGTSEAMMTS